jgi:hypothetical protein
MQHMLEQCVKLNYGQVYEECGVRVVPYSSGSSAAAAMWMLTSLMTKQAMLFTNNLSVHDWRHCLEAEVGKLEGHSFCVVLGGGCVKESEVSCQESFKMFIESLHNAIRANKSSFILIEDLLDILDYIEALNMLFMSSLRFVYIYNPIFKHLIKYANSLVEYLHPYLKSKIYR